MALTIEHESLSHAVVAFLHKGNLNLVLDVLHRNIILYIKMTDNLGDTSYVERLFHSLKCLYDGIHDFVKRKLVSCSITLGNGKLSDFHIWGTFLNFQSQKFPVLENFAIE